MAGEGSSPAADTQGGQQGPTNTSPGTSERPTASTSLRHSIEKLDGTMATGRSNYNAWKFRLIRILKEKGLLLAITNSPPDGYTPGVGAGAANASAAAGKPPALTPELADFANKDNQAVTIITLNVRDSQIPHIQRCKTAKEAWDALQEVHQGIGANGRMVLTQRLWALRLQEGEDMATHLNTFKEIATQIENLSSDDGTSQIQGVDLLWSIKEYCPLRNIPY